MTTTAASTSTPSPSYKKALRHHLKSTRTRTASESTHQWPPFRAAEKKYKARFPPPDVSGVLDLATLDEAREEEVGRGGWKGGADGVGVREIGLAGGRAYTVPRVPGLVVLPSFVDPETQRDLIRCSLRDHARPPNPTNLDTHYHLPPNGLWNAYLKSRDQGEDPVILPKASPSSSPSPNSGPRKLIQNLPACRTTYPLISTAPKPPAPPSPTVPALPSSHLIKKLRWANIGWFYHWGIKQYDFARGKTPIDDRVRDLCKSAVGRVKWDEVFGGEDEGGGGWGEEGPGWMGWGETYEPDAGIVNFYQTKDTLMAHVDRSEISATSPLVSISLGSAAIFLVGDHTRDTEPVPILLRSGDVLIMSGPGCRRAYHGVPRILENTLPPHLEVGDGEWAAYREYLSTARININVRQVFPKGFDPILHHDGGSVESSLNKLLLSSY